MSTPTTEIHVCNLALRRLGQSPVASISSPTTREEDVCALHYDQTRRKVLRNGIYNFAKNLVILTESGTVEPPFGFTTAYKLPNDFIRLLAIGDISINDDTPARLYDMAGGHIYTSSGEDDGLKLHYIFDNTVVATWDPLFVDLLRLQLATDMAYAFTLKASLVKDVREELEIARVAAKAIDGQEKPPRLIERSRFLAARRRGQLSGDPTRIPD